MAIKKKPTPGLTPEQREYERAQAVIHEMRMTEKWPKIMHAHDALPCPFCGAPAEIAPWHGGLATKRLISCSGDDCPTDPSATGETEAEALARWNQRSNGQGA